ncbi:Hypothetical protein NocV09_01300300 [Nannochloropsis oceanica]
MRTITRNARSKPAVALAAQGVELYQGTLLDRPFLDKAMAGVDVLFLATFSDHDGTELRQGKNLGNAAVAAGVQRVVFSGGERIGVDTMDNKIKIEEYLRTLPLPHVVYLHTAFFFENVATKRGTKRVRVTRDPRQGHITQYTFSIPLLQDMRIPFISPTDIGRVAATVLLAPITQFPSGSILPIAGDVLSPREFVSAVARLTGAKATYTQLSLDFFRRLPIPGAELIVQMYEWYHAGCPGEGHSRDPAATRALCTHVRNVEEWLQSDGLALIDRMAYEEGWGSWMHDGLLWGMTHVYGTYMRLKGFVERGYQWRGEADGQISSNE